MSRIDRRSIDAMPINALRDELVWALEQQFALVEALKELPEIAPVPALHLLSEAASWPGDWERGKAMAHEHGIDAIPPVSECENGAGLWARIRAGLIKGSGFNSTASF